MATTRPVEMWLAYDDHTWQDSHFVEIPLDTPEEEIERTAIHIAEERFTDPAIVFIGVYSIPATWIDNDA
jgi:hypothetical protein